MRTDYRYDKKLRTYFYDNGDIDVYHISEKEFARACRPYKKYGLVYSPASYEWQDYPDVGFATLYGPTKEIKDMIIWGHSKYRRLKNGAMKSVAVVTTMHYTRTKHVIEHQYVIDTVGQMQELIEKFFKLRKK